jgi:hypothetical protein
LFAKTGKWEEEEEGQINRVEPRDCGSKKRGISKREREEQTHKRQRQQQRAKKEEKKNVIEPASTLRPEHPAYSRAARALYGGIRTTE